MIGPNKGKRMTMANQITFWLFFRLLLAIDTNAQIAKAAAISEINVVVFMLVYFSWMVIMGLSILKAIDFV